VATPTAVAAASAAIAPCHVLPLRRLHRPIRAEL
jgi:hypothetical protein